MMICWLTLHAAAIVEVDDLSQRTSLLQLRQITNVTASSNTLESSVDAGSLTRDEGAAASALRQAARSEGLAKSGSGPASQLVARTDASVAAATFAASSQQLQQHHSEGRGQQKKRQYAHQNHQYEGRDVGSLFEHKFPSTTCSADPTSAASELVEQVNVIRKNLDYRVGDVIMKGGFFWKSSRENLLTSPYDGTALQTLLKPCAERGDLSCGLSFSDLRDTLESVGQSNGFATPDERTVVAYVRAGDIIGPCEDADETGGGYRYDGNEVAAGLHDPAVKAGIASAMGKGYNRLNFVVVESYADRADAGEHGYWMYSDAKHEENQRQLRAAFEGIIKELCAGGKELSFGVASFVNVDETLFYLMHATTLVTETNRVANHGFPWVVTELTKMQNASTSLIQPEKSPYPNGYPQCSGHLGNAKT